MNHSKPSETKYSITEAGDFAIADYNTVRPFSSFLPGIAGVNGIPLWAFYVNRGQCLCSVGVKDKDHAIMEFQPANRAYDLVTRHGYRTFLKLADDSPMAFYEPFQRHYRDLDIDKDQRMIVGPSHLILEELNHTLQLTFTVEYFPVPEDTYAGLVRTLRITNGGKATVVLDGLDGLPVIVPYGVDNYCLKNMRRTIEAFVEVCNLDAKAPFFKAKVEADDRPDVLRISRGNFYLGFEFNDHGSTLIRPIVDPKRIFGEVTDYGFPERYLAEPIENVVNNQILESQLPCAMGAFRTAIEPNESFTYASVIGHATSIQALNDMLPRIATREYVADRKRVSREIVEQVSQHNLICSSEPRLNLYARQNFLDNTLRGGLPITLTGDNSRTTLHVYSRKHGDLERDYNEFCVMPTRYSQGNGNFRDINQNRRVDVLINPDVQESNIEYFYNLIQLDGFNPLVLKEVHFEARDLGEVRNIIDTYIPSQQVASVLAYVEKPFTPGSLLGFLEERRVGKISNHAAFLGELLSHCIRFAVTEHGEGYWIDHWTYSLDLIENYRAVFPDRLAELLFDYRRFSYHDSPHLVQPRDYKYVLWEGKAVQLNAVRYDKEKAAAHEAVSTDAAKVRTNHGKGEVYHSTLFSKILCLVVNKLASLDPEGVGVEMEAGKPGWYDALNGLPGLSGSSVCETLEIKRHILFMADQMTDYEKRTSEITVFKELKEFMDELSILFESGLSCFAFWDRAGTAKEAYREKTRMGIDGAEASVTVQWLQEFFAAALRKIDAGIEKAKDPQSNTLLTYFRYDIVEYDVVGRPGSNTDSVLGEFDDGLVHIRPKLFEQHPLPLFLEGPVHYLRCVASESEAKDFARNVRRSELYDQKLKMYKVNASLEDQPMEIGRAKVFAPGWLENESIWLHMEYKYMLELLRNGLYDEFYDDFRSVFVPFLDPLTYGRSILENCSFLVSSVHPDLSIHGGGFVARLSGATAEFMHILSLMTQGPRPFRVGVDGTLQLSLKPALPAWLFTKEAQTLRLQDDNGYRLVEVASKTFSFIFLGKILVCFHNSQLQDTFGKNGVLPLGWKATAWNGQVWTGEGAVLEGDMARKVRQRQIGRLDIELI